MSQMEKFIAHNHVPGKNTTLYKTQKTGMAVR